MVLRTVAHDSDEADGTRWSVMSTQMPPETLRVFWLIWVFVASLSAAASFVVIAVIARRPRLRSQPFNLLVVGLVGPDFVFSSCCSITCLLNYLHGEWFGGTRACDWQSLYCIFGTSASIWMNVVVTQELYRMALRTHAMKTYNPLPTREVYRRIGIVYFAALAFSFATGPINAVIPGWPMNANAHRGLFCLPMEEDRESTLWHWLFAINLGLVIPMLAIVYYFSVVVNLLWFSDVHTDLPFSHVVVHERSLSYHSSNKAIVVFFGRLFVVFLIM